MLNLIVENENDIAEAMLRCVTDGQNVSAVLFYKQAVGVVKSLLQDKDIVIHSIELHPAEWDGYNREFYISIDSELNLYVEKAYATMKDNYKADGCLYMESDCVFVDGNASSSILPNIGSKVVIEIDYKESDDLDVLEDFAGECESCKIQ